MNEIAHYTDILEKNNWFADDAKQGLPSEDQKARREQEDMKYRVKEAS